MKKEMADGERCKVAAAMNAASRPFGQLADGSEVQLLALGSADGLQAEVLTLGGILHSLTLPVTGRRIPLVVSLPDVHSYLSDRSFISQLVGRFSNRIGGAAFELDGRRFKLSANHGVNTLHGGEAGFGRQLWRVIESGGGRNSFVKLALHSPDGSNGFPGNLDVVASISIQGNTLTLAWEATTDAPTPVSLTWHPYFNLAGDPARGVEDQTLRMAASQYLPVSAALIPTGEMVAVAGTPFDFRDSKALRVLPADSHPQIALIGGFDHCWVLERNARVAAELHSPVSGVRMQLTTDLPGLQFYGGYHLPTEHPGLHGICLEPEHLPDAPNQPGFPDCTLRPGQVHRSSMSYTFFS
jgi:aldose 1-epimerase